MGNKHTPEIRLAGFTDTWEQRELGDVAERVRGNDGRMDLPTLTISAGSGWLDQQERFSGNIAGKEQKNYTLLSKGELSYNHGNSKLAKYGAVFVLRTYEEALVPRVYHSFKTTEEASSEFIEYMFATKIPDRELAKLISSGARMDGLLNINYDEFMSIKINIPKVEEQMKIAQFLRRLDETITLHQQELATLKQTKQGFLQKMFPENGEDFPEVRFPGFTDAWEQRKLGEVVSLENGYAFKSEYFTDDYKKTIVLTPGSVKIGGGFQDGKGRYYNAKNNFPDKFIFSSGDIFVTMTDLTPSAQSLGYPAIVPDDDNIYLHNQRLGKLIDYSGDKYFLFQLLCTDNYHQQIVSTASGTTVKHSSSNKILGYTTYFPSDEEQAQIGEFFKQLDNLITLHQRELDTLKETKKAFLQKMFV